MCWKLFSSLSLVYCKLGRGESWLSLCSLWAMSFLACLTPSFTYQSWWINEGEDKREKPFWKTKVAKMKPYFIVSLFFHRIVLDLCHLNWNTTCCFLHVTFEMRQKSSNWITSLKTVVNLCLKCQFCMCLWAWFETSQVWSQSWFTILHTQLLCWNWKHPVHPHWEWM